ncbi:hypothetical protein GGR50DRAFT_695159 [Xylaria sp. CBS 124048]|nr:hypothetical protein GGR50DRAFT_695159 [Xylaria sp. CBS 124048]
MTNWWSCLWVSLLLALHIHATFTAGYPVLRRGDVTPTITAALTTTLVRSEGQVNGALAETTTDGPRSTHSSTVDTTTPIVTATTATNFPPAINGNNPGNNSSLETTNQIPEGQLPLRPRLTPGWGIAGALLLVSGVTYTLVGIKNAWLHTFLSAAFLSGLSVTVLIVYVMVTPVSTAIEGAYVVAAVVSGLILGGGATIFREITEGLGCLLGGFCFAMWLLTLKSGGLLTTNPAKAIFISAFAAIGYGLYFNRHTRPYAQMGLMSFAGATVTVIGIDCYSRAGLKEFWAYLWELNTGLFPTGVNTYPQTKGIRVEIALTVVFTVLGIISQLKLWRVIQERRAKKAEEQAREQQARDEEEAALGLQIEAQTAKEREQWEAVYGNKQLRSSTETRDSGVGCVEDRKEAHDNQTASQHASSDEDGIEMAELTATDVGTSPDPTEKNTDGLMTTNPNDDTGVTVRVAEDDELTGNEDLPSVSEPHEEQIEHVTKESRPNSRLLPRPSSKVPGPSITPLPFKIPDELDADDSRSSVAAYADEDDRADVLHQKPSMSAMNGQPPFASDNHVRSASQQSDHSANLEQNTNGFEAQQPWGWADSDDKLARNPRYSGDMLSILATIDALSQDDDDYDYTNDEAMRKSILATAVSDEWNTLETNPNVDNAVDDDIETKDQAHVLSPDDRHVSLAETVATDILSPCIVDSSSGDLSKQHSENTDENDHPTDTTPIEAASESSKPPKSLAQSTTSTNVSLTKDRLPAALPRVALSYRTNEWAKHLSLADTPQLENLQYEEYLHQQTETDTDVEVAAPVHVEELQQTAEDGVPPMAIRPSSSASGSPKMHPTAYRSSLRISSYALPPNAQAPRHSSIPLGETIDAGAWMSPNKSISPNALQTSHSLRNKGQRQSSEIYSHPIREEDMDEFAHDRGSPLDDASSPAPYPIPHSTSPVPGVISYSSPQTLLGKREMLLRNKPPLQLHGISPIQENSHYTTRPGSQMASYGHTVAPPFMTQDADDIPLSQRKQLMYQGNMISAQGQQRNGAISPARSVSSPTAPVQAVTAESSHFDSHQPARRSIIRSQAERDARLSHFRQSVAAGLRAGTPVPALGRETPLPLSASLQTLSWGADVDRTIEQQRAYLMTQREHEAQKRESERWEKELTERTFEEMMRRGDMMDAHREALRRMQGGVKQT